MATSSESDKGEKKTADDNEESNQILSDNPQDPAEAESSGSAGGLYSLSGYYRQILGSIAKSITVYEEVQKGADSTDCEVFFALEEEDEDAFEERRFASANGKFRIERRLIQFKFSRDPHNKQFSPTHLNEIAVAFNRNQDRVNDRNGTAEVVTKFIVASNRGLSDLSREMIESAKGDKKHLKFKDRTKGEKSKLIWAKKAIERLAEIEWEKVSAGQLRARIEERAAELGVRRCEMDDAVGRVVQFFFAQVSESGPTQATIKQVDWLLADAEDARPLLSGGARGMMRDDLEQFGKDAWVRADPMHSRKVESALRDLLERRALIYLYGDGGNGKSSLIYAVLSSGLVGIEPDKDVEVNPSFRVGCLARNWRASSLAEHVARWRGDTEPKHGHELLERSLDRLQAANGTGALPLIFLALDAVDEKTPDTNSANIGQLLTWCKKEDERRMRGESARCVLIVTSRLHPRKVFPSVSPYEDPQEERADDARALQIDGFDADDLITILQVRRDNSVLEPLIEAIDRLIEVVRQREERGGTGLNSATISSSSLDDRRLGRSSIDGFSSQIAYSAFEMSAIDSGNTEDEDWRLELAESLKHPALWRCFSVLEEQVQLGVLQKQPDALNALSKKLMGWFLKKFELRHPGQPHISDAVIRLVLREAALASQPVNQSGKSKQEHWTTPAITAGSDRMTAEQLWLEALSAGIIAESSFNQWYWRHPLFAGALMSDAWA